MATPPSTTVSRAIYSLQLSLIELPCCTDSQLLAAGALLSRPDFADVADERCIAGLCGFPRCSNPLPSRRPHPPRYRIALSEHRVYNPKDTYYYCSESCHISASAFAASLPEKRVADVVPSKLDQILALFGRGAAAEPQNSERNGDLGLSKLTIREKSDPGGGDVPFDQWIGPSNAVEGYASQRGLKQGSVLSTDTSARKSVEGHEIDVDVSEQIAKQLEDIVISENKTKTRTGKGASPGRLKSKASRRVDFESEIIVGDNVSTAAPNASPLQMKQFVGALNDGVQLEEKKQEKKSAHEELKSSLKTNGLSRVGSRSVKWADERGSEKLPEEKTEELQITESSEVLSKKDVDDDELLRVASAEACAAALIKAAVLPEEKTEELQITESSEVLSKKVVDDDEFLRVASAEACAAALIKAAEAVASGDLEAGEAASDAGILILPQSHYDKEGATEANEDMFELDSGVIKWPKKPVLLDTDVFDVEDSWHDTPPEGFNLTLSPFGTMWMSLFGWITCSSLAHIYGQSESSHEEYLSVNGRDYPRKIVLRDGKSSEIRQTLDGYICRALPGLARDLRMPTPVSTMEKALGRLLDTMTFIDALPALRTRQWHVIVLLFLDALSVHRLPDLAPLVTNRNMLLHKVLNAAKISGEEYESMKDLLLPLGRLPQFSMQSGG